MATKVINSSEELTAALKKAKGGEHFALSSGTYSLTLSNMSYSAPVTITSANGSNPANITWLKLTNVSNMTFEGLEIGRALAAGQPLDGSSMAKIAGSSNLTFNRVHVRGSLDDNSLNDGTGLIIGSSKNITITNSEFQQLYRAATFGGVENVNFVGNKVNDVRSDGINFVSAKNVNIENNFFTDFGRMKADHPDAIQFWTTNAKTASTDIVIRNNVILQGNGTGMQGIFMRDEQGHLPFERVLIENNLVYERNMPNGITVIGGKDITVRNNTVTSPKDEKANVWIRLEKIVGGSVTDNVSDAIIKATDKVNFAGNQKTTDVLRDLSRLTIANVPKMSVADLIANGIGFQNKLPSGPVSTPDSEPNRPAPGKTTGAIVDKKPITAASGSSTGVAVMFAPLTLSEVLPADLTSSSGTTSEFTTVPLSSSVWTALSTSSQLDMASWLASSSASSKG